MSHTPGPWEYNKFSQSAEDLEAMAKFGIKPTMLLTNEGQAIVMAGDDRVALVDCHTPYKRGQGYKTECEIREANARLIAAAPDLLAAFHYLIAHVPALGNVPEIRAAIDKAEGK